MRVVRVSKETSVPPTQSLKLISFSNTFFQLHKSRPSWPSVASRPLQKQKRTTRSAIKLWPSLRASPCFAFSNGRQNRLIPFMLMLTAQPADIQAINSASLGTLVFDLCRAFDPVRRQGRAKPGRSTRPLLRPLQLLPLRKQKRPAKGPTLPEVRRLHPKRSRRPYGNHLSTDFPVRHTLHDYFTPLFAGGSQYVHWRLYVLVRKVWIESVFCRRETLVLLGVKDPEWGKTPP